MSESRSQQSPTGGSLSGTGKPSNALKSTRCIAPSISDVSELVIITGPIASGKSAVARSLARLFSQAGRSAVVADLDEVFATSHAPEEQAVRTWARARQVHGLLVGEWLSLGVDAVIADGPFYSEIETAALLQGVPPGIAVRQALLLTTYDVALGRVATEPSRGLSKNAEFLQSAFEEFERQRPHMGPFEWTFDTTKISVADIVKTISRDLIPG